MQPKDLEVYHQVVLEAKSFLIYMATREHKYRAAALYHAEWLNKLEKELKSGEAKEAQTEPA